MSVSVRFAPSPTGLLHVGNIRLALLNWLFAQQNKGQFLLRFDDTDTERSSQVSVDSIQQNLLWLGLTWDKLIFQSERLTRYQNVIQTLKSKKFLYPCYETQEELQNTRKKLQGLGKPPIYDRSALRLSDTQRTALETQGRKPHWRFFLQEGDVSWNDSVKGLCRLNTVHISDPILLREDDTPLYTLSSVIDDIDFSITHVIRGEDHLTNTATQIRLWQALEKPVPHFAHIPLLTEKKGQVLSKRLDSFSIQYLRDDAAIEPMTILSLLAKIGSSDPILPYTSLQPLITDFDFKKISHTPPRFDVEVLAHLNKRLLQQLSFEDVSGRLGEYRLNDLTSEIWEVLRPNLDTLQSAVEWRTILRQPLTPSLIDPKLTASAAQLLPYEPWDTTTYDTWIKKVILHTGKKGKSLFLPLRLALTNKEHGPELKKLLPLLGYKRTFARLTGTEY